MMSRACPPLLLLLREHFLCKPASGTRWGPDDDGDDDEMRSPGMGSNELVSFVGRACCRLFASAGRIVCKRERERTSVQMTEKER